MASASQKTAFLPPGHGSLELGHQLRKALAGLDGAGAIALEEDSQLRLDDVAQLPDQTALPQPLLSAEKERAQRRRAGLERGDIRVARLHRCTRFRTR